MRDDNPIWETSPPGRGRIRSDNRDQDSFRKQVIKHRSCTKNLFTYLRVQTTVYTEIKRIVFVM